jgi:hypothetical protein
MATIKQAFKAHDRICSQARHLSALLEKWSFPHDPSVTDNDRRSIEGPLRKRYCLLHRTRKSLWERINRSILAPRDEA